MATKKQTKIEPAHNGSFLTGLTVGLFAGAFGYYLFNTARGEKMRASLAAEWDEIRKKLYAEGLIPSADLSLNEVLSEHLSTLSAWFGRMAEVESDGASPKKKSPAPQQPEKFTGVKK
jgi:hypothetical protein